MTLENRTGPLWGIEGRTTRQAIRCNPDVNDGPQPAQLSVIRLAVRNYSVGRGETATAGDERQPIEASDDDEKESISRDQRQILQRSAKHRPEQIRAERGRR